MVQSFPYKVQVTVGQPVAALYAIRVYQVAASVSVPEVAWLNVGLVGVGAFALNCVVQASGL